MWYPGYERLYNERLSPRITYALGRTIINQATLAQLHPGLVNYSTKDEFTNSLLIRGRLQYQSTHWLSDVQSEVTNVPYAPVGGK